MKAALIGVGVAFCVIGFCALIAWLGGYDFDHRSPDVAAAATFAILMSVFAGFAGWLSARGQA